MKNQIDREIQEQYIEGVLNQSQNWDWFVEYIENTFEINFEINSFDDFRRCYSDVRDVYSSLIRINRYLKEVLTISKLWLKTLNEISLFYWGKIEYSEINLYDDFSKTLALFSYTAKLYNETNHLEMVLYSDIFEYCNLYKLYKMDLFILNSDFIISELERIGYNTDSKKTVFQNNTNEIFIPCNHFLDDKRSSIVQANSFNYLDIKGVELKTWQEKYLHEMLQTNYSHGKLSPWMTTRDGHSAPDFSAWSADVLDLMKYDFNDEDATFIIESVLYSLYGTPPSSNTILKHAKLLYNYWIDTELDEKNYFVSSFEFLVSFFNDKRINIDSQVWKLYHTAVKTITDDEIVLSINSRYMLRDKSIRKRIYSIIKEKKSNIINISSESDFLATVEDEVIISETDNQVFNILSNKFDDILAHGSRLLPSLFLKYLIYLIRIRQKCLVQQDEVSKEIIRIRYLWQDEYHIYCAENMTSVKKKFIISNEEVDKYNDSALKNPYVVALNCMILDENALVNTLISTSKNVFSLLVTKIMVNEDFPSYSLLNLKEGRHEIDYCLNDYIMELTNTYSYKMMNLLESDKFLAGVYESIMRQTELYMAMLNNESELYQLVIDKNPEYDFIEYSDSPKLAHLTQLFPIIENKIRYYGELIGIAPICLEINRYNQLKEPATILTNIIVMIYESTNALRLGADFFMLYFCLYSSYGFNIRNEAIHGKGFVKEKKSIAKAFRITLFCLYLIDYRIDFCFEEMRRKTRIMKDTKNSSETNENDIILSNGSN